MALWSSGDCSIQFGIQQSRTQCDYHFTHHMLCVHRMLVTKHHLVRPQLHRYLHLRLFGLVLPLHRFSNSYFVRLSALLSEYVLKCQLLIEGFVFRCSWFYHFTMVLVFTNSCINPFIYAAKYREFQHGVRRMVSKQSNASTSL